MVTDPVCGRLVDEALSTIQADYKDRTFSFCSEECKEVFQTNPEPYAQGAA